MTDDPLLSHLREVVVGELAPVRVELVEYDTDWPHHFDAQARRIEAALGAVARRIEHIGSTAVPDLVAKPVVDLLVVVDDPGHEATYLPALEAVGYELRVREPTADEHRMLRTPRRDAHVHILPPWSPEVERYLALRDHLRTDAHARATYAAHKRALARRTWPTMDHDANAKGSVIEALIADAGGPPPRPQ